MLLLLQWILDIAQCDSPVVIIGDGKVLWCSINY